MRLIQLLAPFGRPALRRLDSQHPSDEGLDRPAHANQQIDELEDDVEENQQEDHRTETAKETHQGRAGISDLRCRHHAYFPSTTLVKFDSFMSHSKSALNVLLWPFPGCFNPIRKGLFRTKEKYPRKRSSPSA